MPLIQYFGCAGSLPLAALWQQAGASLLLTMHRPPEASGLAIRETRSTPRTFPCGA